MSRKIRTLNKLFALGHIDENRHFRAVSRVINRECSRRNHGCDVSVATRTSGGDEVMDIRIATRTGRS